MVRTVVTDDKTNLPKFQQDGVTKRMSSYIAVAIPKIAGVPWRQTEWGQVIVREAQESWNLGESLHPTFAWKVTDGDSTIPKKPFGGKPGRIPAQCEGYPGHWVISCSTELGIKCYHVGKYAPHEEIQNKEEIKCGDYCRVLIGVKSNKPSQSPGVYINPTLFELSRAGQRIVTGDGPDAATAFGGSAPVLPANGQYDSAVAEEPRYIVNGVEYTVAQLRAARWTEAQIAAAVPVAAPPSAPAPAAPAPVVPPPSAPAPSAPAMDFLQPPAAPVATVQYFIQGQVYTREQLVGFGWTEQQIALSPVYTGDNVPF
jgi:hypothetical protein